MLFTVGAIPVQLKTIFGTPVQSAPTDNAVADGSTNAMCLIWTHWTGGAWTQHHA